MYVSDFKEYLNRHGIQCTTNELCHLFSPYVESQRFVTSSEFASFANNLKMIDEYSIVTAFPETFGVSTHIELPEREPEPSDLEGSCLRRNHAVSANLCQLPAYYALLNMS